MRPAKVERVLAQLRDEVRWQRDPDIVATMQEMDRSIQRIAWRVVAITAALFATLLLAIKIFG